MIIARDFIVIKFSKIMNLLKVDYIFFNIKRQSTCIIFFSHIVNTPTCTVFTAQIVARFFMTRRITCLTNDSPITVFAATSLAAAAAAAGPCARKSLSDKDDAMICRFSSKLR